MVSKHYSVAFFLPDLSGGGAERVFFHLAVGFANQGIKVDLVLANATGEYLKHTPSTIRIVDLKATSPKTLTKTLALKRYLRQEQPTALFSTLDILSSATWGRILSGTSTRVFMVAQTHLSQQFHDKPQLFLGRLRSLAVRYFYPWADAIIAASQGVAQDVANLTDLPLEQISVIYNPVVMPELFEKAKEPVEHPWFKLEEPPVILGVGRLVRQKDFETLIRAFALVRQQRPARLMILGLTDEREAFMKPHLESVIQELQLEDDVALPGFVDNPYAYMARASVFALSSIYEGFGNVVAEALATGTTIVSTDCESGPAEILGNGKYGRLVPVKNVSALSDAILAALDSPDDPERLRQRSLDFSIDYIVNQYLDVLNRVIESNDRKEVPVNV